MSQLAKEKPLVVAIAGPTATGKTEAAIALCKALDGEVISMDSMQIYEGMDIGTAKPTAGTQYGVPHHLLSFVKPTVGYTVAEYQQDAARAMEVILQRQRLPVFAGGTGLYLQAISHPLSFGGAGQEPAIRQRLEKEAATPGGPQRLWERLHAIDPISAQKLHVNNLRRIIRALEIGEVTGLPPSSVQQDWQGEPEQDFCIFALTWPRDVLIERIEERAKQMMDSGLVEEVKDLLSRGVPRNAQAMQAIGYKEIAAMLAGECTKAEALLHIQQHTRQYAKRQITWLKREKRARWIHLEQYPTKQAAHEDIIAQVLAYKEIRHDDHG